MFFWIFAVSILGLIFWYYLLRSLNYWTRKGVKQSKPWIVLSDNWHTLFRMKSFAEGVEWVYWMFPKERYSGIYQFGKPVLLLRDPELIKQLTVKDFDHFTDHFTFFDVSTDPLWGGNLFALKGNSWRHMRATLSAAFTSSKMRFMFGLISDAAENFTRHFDANNEDVIELEMKDAYTRCTNDIIATTAFGIKVDSLKDPENEFYLMGKQATTLTGLKTTLKFFAYFLAPKLAKFFQLQLFDKSVSRFFRTLIDETIEVREAKGIVRPDMINILLEARKGSKVFDDKEKDVDIDTGFATVEESDVLFAKTKPKLEFTNENITAQALIFFFAGFDTVSAALCFSSYELATHAEVQQKLRNEINETLKKGGGKLTYETLLKMKYMDMVITETLRLWTPALATDRICVKPYVIEPTRPEEQTIYLDIGDMISIPLHAIHRDPTYYPEPEKFIPERFSEENKHNIVPYTYMPFGVGPRNCIGSRFALLEIKAVLFQLLSKYEIVPTEKTDIPMRLKRVSFQHTAANGFWFGLKRIKK